MINLQTVPEISGIYKFTNTIKNKVYIGQAVNLKKRINEHLKFYKTADSYFYFSMRKHKIENFEVEILQSGNFSKTELDQMEITYIRLFKSQNPKLGYNMTGGGGGTIGIKQSPELIKKRFDSRKGYKHSEETKKLIGLKSKGRNLGKKHSEESKLLMSKNIKGKSKGKKRKPFTQETKDKMSKASLGKKMVYKNGKNPQYIDINLSEFEKNCLKIINEYKYKQDINMLILICEILNLKRGLVENRLKTFFPLLHVEIHKYTKQKCKKHTEETKQKISESKKGKPKSQEHKEKLRQANLGFKHSEESKNKMKGRKHSKEIEEKRIRTLKFNKMVKYFQKNNWINEWII